MHDVTFMLLLDVEHNGGALVPRFSHREPCPGIGRYSEPLQSPAGPVETAGWCPECRHLYRRDSQQGLMRYHTRLKEGRQIASRRWVITAPTEERLTCDEDRTTRAHRPDAPAV